MAELAWEVPTPICVSWAVTSLRRIWPHCHITQLPKMPEPLCVCSLVSAAACVKPQVTYDLP
jgi:hypothetical protein